MQQCNRVAAISDTRTKRTCSKFVNSRLLITFCSVVKSFWNFTQEHDRALSCSEQICKTIWQLNDSHGLTRFREIWVLDKFRTDILYCNSPPFTKRMPDLVKSRSRGIRISTFPIALKFNRHLGSSAAEMPVKFQSDTSLQHPIWRLQNFPRFGSMMFYRLVNRGPDSTPSLPSI